LRWRPRSDFSELRTFMAAILMSRKAVFDRACSIGREWQNGLFIPPAAVPPGIRGF
jgi:hypothetical protein